jgi:hypothetical protein
MLYFQSYEHSIAKEDPVKLSAISEMGALDRTTIQQFGIAEELLCLGFDGPIHS